MNELFTIIIPCYKNSELLEECLDSVLCQTYPQIELIVCDDCSGDFDVHKYQKYIQNNKTTRIIRYDVYSNSENMGTVKNLNRAIEKAHGHYIKILAADDALADISVLESVAHEFKHIDNDCILCDVLLCDNYLTPIQVADTGFIQDMDDLDPDECFRRLCVRNRINAVGVFFKHSFFERNGLFDEKYHLLEDWPTWLRLYSRGELISHFQFVATKRRMAVGVVANNNPAFLADRRLVWSDIIKPNRAKLGWLLYIKSFIGAYFFTIPLFRKIYYRFRKGDAQ